MMNEVINIDFDIYLLFNNDEPYWGHQLTKHISTSYY